MELAADALTLAGVSPRHPLDAEGLWARYMPELVIRGNTAHQKSTYVLRAVAMAHGGVIPDIGADAGWWRADDLWYWASLALALYVRVASDRLSRPIANICQELARGRATGSAPETERQSKI
jgi:hypothetical protein